MLSFPVHPRQARLIAEAEARGVGEEGCVIAALIGERDIRIDTRGAGLSTTRSGPARAMINASSDLLVLLDAFKEAEKSGFSQNRIRAIGLDTGATLAVERVRRQLARQLEKQMEKRQKIGMVEKNEKHREKIDIGGIDSSLLVSILSGYPDRVARARRNASGERIELLLSGGGSAILAETSVVRASEYLVAIDTEQRQGQAFGAAGGGRGATTLVRVASRIEPDWLLDLFIDSIRETVEMKWNEQAKRVEVVRRLIYDQLVIDESRSIAAKMAEATPVLVEAALAAGPRSFVVGRTFDRFLARINFIAATFPEAKLPQYGEEQLQEALARLCANRTSFAELREAARAGGLIAEIQHGLSGEQLRLLHTMAPSECRYPADAMCGSNTKSANSPG